MGSVVIKDLLPPKVMVSGIELRGITLEETVGLIDKYKEQLSAFFSTPQIDFSMLAMQSPGMVADIIGLGAEAKGQEDDIKKLPLQSQIEMLSAIWEQTVPNVEGLLASLVKASESLRVAREGTNSHLPLRESSRTSSTPSLIPDIH